jgi:hypothetical protein
LSDSLGRQLQSFLNSRGFQAGRIDGIVGTRTTRALQEYLRDKVDQAIKVDGIWGPQTARIFEASLGRTLGGGRERTERVRLVIHTSSRKRSDYFTFEAEAMRLVGDYQRHYRNDRIRRVLVHSGQELVHTINGCAINSIVSLDIVSHSNFGGIHISTQLTSPRRADARRQEAHLRLRSNGRNPQSAKDAMFMEEELRGLYTDDFVARKVADYFNQDVVGGTAYLDDVYFDRFADECYVELHGCRTADRSMPLDYNDDAFIVRLSDELPCDAFVIGHTGSSYPRGSDGYRHGEVSVLRGGREVFTGPRERLELPNASTPGDSIDSSMTCEPRQRDDWRPPSDNVPSRDVPPRTQPPRDIPPPIWSPGSDAPRRRGGTYEPRPQPRDTRPQPRDNQPPRRSDETPPQRRDEPREDHSPSGNSRPHSDVPWGAIVNGAVAIGSMIYAGKRASDRRRDRDRGGGGGRDDHRRDDHRRDDHRDERRHQPAHSDPRRLGGFGGFGAFGRNR